MAPFAGRWMDGVNLLSGLPFARENRLHLNIKLIPEEPPLMATGEVRWYDIARDIPEFICRLGVAFIEIKDGGKDQLARFLKKHQNNKGYFQKLQITRRSHRHSMMIIKAL